MAAKERREKLDPEDWAGARLLGRLVPAVRTPEGIRALEKDLRPASAESVERYLEGKFGDGLADVRAAMERLAGAMFPQELNQCGFAIHEAFRPAVPAGAQQVNLTWTGSLPS